MLSYAIHVLLGKQAVTVEWKWFNVFFMRGLKKSRAEVGCCRWIPV